MSEHSFLNRLSLLIPIFLVLYILYTFVMSFNYSFAMAERQMYLDYMKCDGNISASDYSDNTYKFKKYFGFDRCSK